MTVTRNVATASDAQTAMVSRSELIRTLVGGTVAMRAAGEKYLPKEAAESKEAYAARLARSVLFNATGKTVDDMTGKVFAKPVSLEKDVPERLREYAENVDLAGRHLNVFAKDVFADGMQTGIGYILVDMPPAVQSTAARPASQAEEKAAGVRPYLVYIPLERMLGWKSEIVNGAERLTQIRYRESVREADGEFHEKEVDQVRVITPGKWQTYRKVSDKDEWVLHEQGTITITNKIALAPVYINRSGFMQGEPPLRKLAELNVAHWQSSSDQRNILHVARVPILFGAGFHAEDTIEIGGSRMVRTSDVGATLQYVEHGGTAIESGQIDLDKLEQQMQTMGLQLLVDKPGQTATGEVRDDVKENSPLAMMATGLQDALEMAFGFMAEFMKEASGGSLIVNKDFGIQLGAATLQDLISMRSAGHISQETFWTELQRRGVLSDSFDPKVEKERLDSEPPELGMNLGG